MLPDNRWIDTLALAKAQFPGAFNSLDALCKRYRISLAEREKHGALIDTRLLAQVYLELRGGREAKLDLARVTERTGGVEGPMVHGPRPRPLAPRASPSELALHEAFVRDELKSRTLWTIAEA